MVDHGERWRIARRIIVWAVPGVLVAALAWSLLPPRTPQEAHLRPPVTAPAGPTGQAGAGHSGEATSPAGAAGESAPPAAATPYGEIRRGDLTGTDASGHKRWRIVADQVILGQGKQVVLLEGVRGTFYAPDGTTMTVTGKLGRYDTGTQDIDLEGDVHGMSSSGRELFCDRLHYSPASDEVTGTGHIRLIQERAIVYADRMVSNTALGQTRFSGNVHIAAR